MAGVNITVLSNLDRLGVGVMACPTSSRTSGSSWAGCRGALS